MANNFPYTRNNQNNQFPRPQLSRPTHRLSNYRLHNYRGPYDRIMLEDAKNDLQQTVDSRMSTLWKRIKLKTGIGENGKRDTKYNGWGKHSTTFSHALFPDVKETYSDSHKMYYSEHKYPQKTSTVTSNETMNNLEEGVCMDVHNEMDGCLSVTFDSHSDIGIASKHDNPIEGLTLPRSTDKLSQNSEDSAVECEFINENTDTTLETCISVNTDSKTINNPINNKVVIFGSNHENVEIPSDVELSCNMEVNGVLNDTDMKHEDMTYLDHIFEQIKDLKMQSTKNKFKCTEVLKSKQINIDVDIENVKKAEMQLANEFDGEFFKCDFCGVSYKDKVELVSHLMTKKHYSASTFESKVKSGKKVIILVEEMSLVNKDGRDSMIILSNMKKCNMIFSDMYACTRHLASQHFVHPICSKRKYGLVKVVKEEICVNPKETLKCEKCNEVFKTRPLLSKHYVKQKHVPYMKGGYNQMFKCCYCAYTCRFILNILKHQDINHSKLVVNGTLKYKVVHFQGKQWFYLSENGISTPTTRYNKILKETKIKQKTETDMFYIDQKSLEIDTQKELGNKEIPVISYKGKSTSNNDNACGYRDDMPFDQNAVAGPNLAVDVTDEETSVNEDSYYTKQERGDLLVKYKCDYCPIRSDSQGMIMDHLQSAHHVSASTLLVSADNKQMFLKDSGSSIICKTFANTTVTAICPEASCSFLFPSIYSCYEHYSTIHDQTSRPTYALANIIKSCVIQIPRGSFSCLKCANVFPTQSLLNRHYKISKHYPFELRNDSEVYFTCMYCKNYKHLTFTQIVHHVSNKHNKKGDEDTFSVQAIYVSKDRLNKFLPSFKKDNQGEKDVIQTKIVNLNVLMTATVGIQKKALRSEIRTLKNDLKLLK